MRSLQEIFDTVFEAGCYRFGNTNEHMCLALNIARKHEIISYSEWESAREAAQCFVIELLGVAYYYGASLRSALDAHKYKCDFETRLRIYRNWDNRWNMLERVCESTD